MKTMVAKNEYSVFLVDDDKMFLTSLKNSLQQQFGPTLKVSEYATGEECIEHIVDDVPDIVILDYYLNDVEHPDAMDGIKVLKEIKSESKDSIVIMLSGQDKLQVAIDSIKNGAYEYIAKSESAFVRIENTLKNAIDNLKSEKENNKYFKWNVALAIIIASIILIDVIWYYSSHYSF
ncbi:MAG TPA: response regulator [Bacteroidia bacterium]|nr:response regulator [Bacteroidia bacterium]